MGNFHLRSFDQILEDIRQARSWYEGIGIKTSGTRLEMIESRTDDFLRDLKSSTPQEVVARWDSTDTYYVLSDGAGFGRIAREIGRVGPNLMPKKELRAILEGPISPRDEVPGDASVNARNFFTELELAAYLSEKGISPTGFDDLSFRFRGVNFEVQCKRLLSTSLDRVRENIEKAYTQLQRNMATDYDRGLIALAIEKIMSIEGKCFRVEEESDLTHEVQRLSEEFRTRFGHSWWGFVDPRVIGLALIVRFLGYSVKQNVIGPVYYVALANLASPDAFQAADLELLRQFAAQLGRVPGQR